MTVTNKKIETTGVTRPLSVHLCVTSLRVTCHLD